MVIAIPARLKRYLPPAPTVATFPGVEFIAAGLGRQHRPARPLAAPPPGSGLAAVPGDPGPPLIGYSLDMVLDANRFAITKVREHGPIFWGNTFGMTGVFTSGDAANEVLANRDKAFDSGWDSFIGRFFNRGLLLLPDSGEHPRHRRIMQWAFTRPRLAGYVARMDELVSTRMPAWTDGKPGGQVQFYPAMKQLSLDIATVLFMDGELGESAELEAAFEAAVHAGSAIARFPVPGLSWSKGISGRKKLEAHFRAKLPAKRAADRNDLFAALCHARSDTGEQFSDDDVVNHMIFLMMAAHDTSTITATGAAYYLAKFPQWQDRARADCLALGDSELDTAALDSLIALDLVVKETLRLVTTVPAIIRRAIRDTAIDGYFVPKGTNVTVMPGVNHRMTEFWTDPDTFDPDRFVEPRREDKSHRTAFVPFGGGAHRCIGLHFGTYEVKIVLHRLLTRYRLEAPADYELKWDKSALWFPPDGLPITLRPLAQADDRDEHP